MSLLDCSPQPGSKDFLLTARQKDASSFRIKKNRGDIQGSPQQVRCTRASEEKEGREAEAGSCPRWLDSEGAEMIQTLLSFWLDCIETPKNNKEE